MTVVSRDDHLKYGWKWNMMKDVWNPHLVYHALPWRIQVKPFLTSPAAHQLSAINTSNHLSINANVIESFIDDSPINWVINLWRISMDSSHSNLHKSKDFRSVPSGRPAVSSPGHVSVHEASTRLHVTPNINLWGEPLRPIGADWADWAEKSIEKSIGLKAARNLPWVYGGPEFVPWPNFRTKQPHLPQVALPRHAMMARANVWVCFGTGEDPTKLFGIHEQAIDAKHLGQLWIWWCYSTKHFAALFILQYPLETKIWPQVCRTTVRIQSSPYPVPLFLWVFTNIQFHNVSQILHNPIFAHCSCQRFRVSNAHDRVALILPVQISLEFCRHRLEMKFTKINAGRFS